MCFRSIDLLILNSYVAALSVYRPTLFNYKVVNKFGNIWRLRRCYIAIPATYVVIIDYISLELHPVEKPHIIYILNIYSEILYLLSGTLCHRTQK